MAARVEKQRIRKVKMDASPDVVIDMFNSDAFKSDSDDGASKTA